MRLLALLCALLTTPTAMAVERIELQVGSVAGEGWHIQDVRLDWQIGGSVRASAAKIVHPALSGATRIAADCAALRGPSPRCDSATLAVDVHDGGSLKATLDARLQSVETWQVTFKQLEASLSYNSKDGLVAAEQLQLSAEGEARSDDGAIQLALQLHAAAGQAYVEPVFVDFSPHPLSADVQLSWPANARIELAQFAVTQQGIGTVTASGSIDADLWAQHHDLQVNARIEDGDAATALYLQPALAATPLKGTALSGQIEATVKVIDGAPQRASARMINTSVAMPAFSLAFADINGAANWSSDATATSSSLRWHDGSVGRIPLGGAELQFTATQRAFELTQPLRIPIFDGGLAIEQLVVDGIGGDNLSADFAAEVLPIDLREICRALGWPEFSGTIAGRLPGLHLKDQRLELDGALTATAFDGEIEVGDLVIIEPLGVLPRIRADIRLRRLDLAALTGAFDFGRITGRLDGDVAGLRLIGWEPVVMNAKLYSTPRDRTRKRISQRAIDSISSIGGGPTGLLSRGFMSFFDDFAYDRIGWSCVLDNGVCRMDGVEPSKEGNGYVLVKGRGLPRIDVVGFSRRVSWPVFMAQLKSISDSGPVEVR